MELKVVTIQEINGSHFVYIPKAWAKEMNLKKSDKVSWILKEGDHKSLILKIKENEDVQ